MSNHTFVKSLDCEDSENTYYWRRYRFCRDFDESLVTASVYILETKYYINSLYDHTSRSVPVSQNGFQTHQISVVVDKFIQWILKLKSVFTT